MRTFLSILFISTLMASVGTTATRKRIVKPAKEWVNCVFVPDEELIKCDWRD